MEKMKITQQRLLEVLLIMRCTEKIASFTVIKIIKLIKYLLKLQKVAGRSVVLYIHQYCTSLVNLGNSAISHRPHAQAQSFVLFTYM